MKAVIIGATGLVGSKVIQGLLSDSDFTSVVCVSRKSLNIKNEKLKEIIINSLNEILGLREKLSGDVFFCCLGTTIKTAGSQEAFRQVDFKAVVDFAKVAKENHGSSFVLVSAQGANSNSSIFYNKVKGEAEEELRKMDLNNLIIMRPSLLIGDRKESRPMEKAFISIYKVVQTFIPEKLAKLAGTDVNRLADKMVLLSKSKNKYLQVEASAI